MSPSVLLTQAGAFALSLKSANAGARRACDGGEVEVELAYGRPMIACVW